MSYMDFNASAVPPAQPFSALPKGQYIAYVTNSEVRPNKKGTGHILALTFVIAEGEYMNRKVFDCINIQHDNPKVQKIGQAHLSSLCHAICVLKLENSIQLHNKRVKIDLSIEAGSNGYSDKNRITGFTSLGHIPDTDDDVPF